MTRASDEPFEEEDEDLAREWIQGNLLVSELMMVSRVRKTSPQRYGPIDRNAPAGNHNHLEEELQVLVVNQRTLDPKIGA